jgi:hypothetical protein
MNELLVGYARVSTEQQDLTAQRNGLHALGVGNDRIHVDHGLPGANTRTTPIPFNLSRSNVIVPKIN